MCLETTLAPFPGSCVREPLLGDIPAIAWEVCLAWGDWGLNASYRVSAFLVLMREALCGSLCSCSVTDHWLGDAWAGLTPQTLSLSAVIRPLFLCWFNTTVCQTLTLSLHVALWLLVFFFFSTKVHLGRNSPNTILLKAQQTEQCEKIGVVLLGTWLAGMGRISL